MADFNIVGFDEVERMLLLEAENLEKTVDEMLTAGGNILVEAQRNEVKSLDIVDKGELIKSIKIAKITRKDSQAEAIVSPTGKDRKGIRNAEKGFIAEYGKSNIPPRPWQERANIKSENAVHEAMLSVWENNNNE